MTLAFGVMPAHRWFEPLLHGTNNAQHHGQSRAWPRLNGKGSDGNGAPALSRAGAGSGLLLATTREATPASAEWTKAPGHGTGTWCS